VPGEIVLYTAHATNITGDWTPTADATAAAGTRLQNRDGGAPKRTAALAAPLHFFELTFEAEARKPYRLWLRAKAEKDSYLNDSVYVQFNQSVDAVGAPMWRIGTISGTPVVLEDAGGAGVSGWGWQDNGYGPGALGPVVYFGTAGTQRLRIQVREDGLGIDQVVLSPARYLTVSPGATKNDTTIVPR
jgi:hypothetical protein